MTTPSVSIVIPTYRSAAFLSRAMDSVCAQTFGDWELIIIDGMSDDGTRDIVEGYRDRLGERLVFIEQENRGCCFARNTGIDASRGRWVAFLDSDDEFLPTKLSRQMELFDLCPELGLVYSDYSCVDLSGRGIESVFDELQTLARGAPYIEVAPDLRVCRADLFEYLIRGYFISTIVGMVRREVLADDIRFLENQDYNHEWVFYLDIIRRCQAGYVNEPLSVHHFVEGSLTRRSATMNMARARDMFRVMRRRYADESRYARRALDRQLATTCRQLGFDAYKRSDFRNAAAAFGESLAADFDFKTGVHWVQSLTRSLGPKGCVKPAMSKVR